MNVALTKPTVTLTLTIDEAHALYVDLEDVSESQTGPGITRTTERIMAELGATLEDGGYLPEDPDDDPPLGNVIPITIYTGDTEPSLTAWHAAFADAAARGVSRRAV